MFPSLSFGCPYIPAGSLQSLPFWKGKQLLAGQSEKDNCPANPHI